MTNSKISVALNQIADLLEFQGANPFRVRAYRTGAHVVQELGEPVTGILADAERKLTDIRGIGADLADKIAAMVSTGQIPMLVQLQSEVPESVLALLRVPGLGPKKAATLFKELKVTSLDELRQACQEHRVQVLKGFGEKTEQTILAGLDFAASTQERMYWAHADQYVEHLLGHMQGVPGVAQIVAAGSYRRARETVGDLDLLAEANAPGPIMDRLASYERIAEVIGRGDTKMSIRLDSGLQVDLRVVPAQSFGAALQYFTGSQQHNIILRGRAKNMGLKINEYGVYRGDEAIAGHTEEEVYRALGLPLIPPELREGRQEFAWAEAKELPELVALSDIRGDLHMHTDATDGNATIEQMSLAAKARGLSYIAITDHSKRVTMANGLDRDRLLRQWEALDLVATKMRGFKVLKGVEVDILEKGGLDLDDEVLEQGDWVVASVHYGQNQSREQITARIVEAISHPGVSAIAHPTGRLINRRPAYDVDLDAVFEAAKKHGKLMELNANPARLDLDDVACARAKHWGIPIVISTDAHSIDGLDVMRYGILQARRAGLTAADVANTRPWNELRKLIGRAES